MPAIRLIGTVLTIGTVGTKFGLVGLPCPLFTALEQLIFTQILGDWSGDLTYCTIGELSIHYGFGASVDSSDSSSPSDIGWYSSSLSDETSSKYDVNS